MLKLFGRRPWRIVSQGFCARLFAGESFAVTSRCGKTSFREAALFTHRGLSGPAILQISSYWRKGEQVVLVTDAPDARRVDLIGWAQNHGVTELAVPRHLLTLENIPVLGTGKIDYGRVEKFARALRDRENPA